MLEFIDVTGNRRVWPVSLAKEVDVEAILWRGTLFHIIQSFYRVYSAIALFGPSS
jgi:hypothetical protein